MNGRRLPDGAHFSTFQPGDYAWSPYDGWEQKPSHFIGAGEWHLMDPTGGVGAAGRDAKDKGADHTWVEHEDGTVTFSPSLVMPSGWHGYLERGSWRSV